MATFASSTCASSPVSGILSRLRVAQSAWADVPVRGRLRLLRRLRGFIADRAEKLARTVSRPHNETLTAEILPLAEACRFLEVEAEKLLAPKRLNTYAPLWMRSVELTTRREPFGAILIVGPANYPIFLPGVQLVQALVAGNGVLLKPGKEGTGAASLLIDWLREAGLDHDLAVLLDESEHWVHGAIQAGVDKVLITGSLDTGKAVLASVASRVTPVVAELSGWDPVFVLPGADISLVLSALRFGLALNRGATCIRPRVIYAESKILSELHELLGDTASEFELAPVSSETEALQLAGHSSYALGATVFGPTQHARAFSNNIQAGVVVINDMIVPTAHPSLPFGGRRASGFGSTRGAEGLLELTTLKTVALQRGRWRPHLGAAQPADARLFTAFIRALHGNGLTNRLRAGKDLWRAIRNRSREI